MKPILFSKHSLDQMADRGVSREEVELTIRTGEKVPGKKGGIAFRKNFAINSIWKGKYYEIKQVMPITVEERDKIVVITAYAFYFGGAK